MAFRRRRSFRSFGRRRVARRRYRVVSRRGRAGRARMRVGWRM